VVILPSLDSLTCEIGQEISGGARTSSFHDGLKNPEIPVSVIFWGGSGLDRCTAVTGRASSPGRVAGGWTGQQGPLVALSRYTGQGLCGCGGAIPSSRVSHCLCS
jgi:hypothetical protein